MDRSKVAAWLMFLGGAVGAVLALLGIIFPKEPPGLTQLSWGAIWTTGLVGIIAAKDSKPTPLSDEDIERIAIQLDKFFWAAPPWRR